MSKKSRLRQWNVTYKCQKCGNEWAACETTGIHFSPRIALEDVPVMLPHKCEEGDDVLGVATPYYMTECKE